MACLSWEALKWGASCALSLGTSSTSEQLSILESQVLFFRVACVYLVYYGSL